MFRPVEPERSQLGGVMDEFERNSVIDWYELLEDRLLGYLGHVPRAESNLKVFFPELAGIILEASGLLDSVFREIAPEPMTVNGVVKQRNDLCTGAPKR